MPGAVVTLTASRSDCCLPMGLTKSRPLGCPSALARPVDKVQGKPQHPQAGEMSEIKTAGLGHSTRSRAAAAGVLPGGRGNAERTQRAAAASGPLTETGPVAVVGVSSSWCESMCVR